MRTIMIKIKKLSLVRFLLVLSVIILQACGSGDSNNFVINGKASGLEGANIILLHSLKPGKVDTLGRAIVKDGQFNISGELQSPVFARLAITSPQYYSSFWLPPSEVEIDLDTARVDEGMGKSLIPLVKGSVEQEVYDSFSDQYDLISRDIRNESKLLQKTTDPEEKKKITEKIDKLRDELTEKSNGMILDFVKKNNSSVVSAYLMARILNDQYHKVETLQSVMDNFTPEVKLSPYYLENRDELDLLMRIQPGKPAPDFSLPDMQGNDFQFSSLKGKVVLIDFWASWCKPCIASIPAMKNIYNTYKEKGFEILGLSNDSKKDAWLKSIEINTIPWKNVVDRFPQPPAPFGPAEVATLYGISYLPTTILVDREGIIIAKNLHAEELETKLKEIFKN